MTRKMCNSISAERLRELLHYNPLTGEFTRRVRTSNRIKVGSVAGGMDGCQGYRKLRVGGHLYKAHRLAWLYMTGEWPENQIDHINCDKADNRWINLRVASRSQNSVNTGVSVINTSGVKGVCWHKSTCKWQARVGAGGEVRHLGTFADPKDAALAYATAAYAIYGEFARPQWRDVLAGIRGVAAL